MDGNETTEQLALEARAGLSIDAIQDQLERILVHPEFQATEKMRRFLPARRPS